MTTPWRRIWPALVVAGLFCLPASASQEEVDKQQQQLKQLQREIAEKQAELIKQRSSRNNTTQKLKQDERAISKQAAAIKANLTKLNGLNADLAQLTKQQNALEKTYQGQQQQLAAQIKASWISGKGEVGQLLLNQNSADKQRLLTYYQYLNQARIDAMEAIKATKIALEANHQAQLEHRDQLKKTQSKLDRQQLDLKKQKQQRQRTLAKIEDELRQGNRSLSRLEVDSEVLSQAIEEALIALANQPLKLDGLAKLKGKLAWPVSGKISKKFGSHRQGQLRWNGLVISALEGQDVKAVAPGQVVFADWLRGYGMVVVVDHGKEYLSLYGQAQSLLKNVGDPVKEGEVIALSGKSGGLAQSGLYFEIRHQGLAVNPSPYLKRL